MKTIEIEVGCILWTINVTKDFTQPGSFRFDEVSDWDYYGYRDTQWSVERARMKVGVLGDVDLVDLTASEIDDMLSKHESQMHTLVQAKLDEDR